MNEFDKLFNENFGDDDEQNKGLNKIMDLMSKLNAGDGLAGLNDEEALGEPTSKRQFERDGVMFEESTWDTPHGTIVRIATIEDIEFTSDFFNKNNIPFGKSYDREELTLEEQLKILVKEENYEEAAIIRDLIDKKDNKDKVSENLDNKGIPDKDEWNF
jgi:hypothetical protein